MLRAAGKGFLVRVVELADVGWVLEVPGREPVRYRRQEDAEGDAERLRLRFGHPFYIVVSALRFVERPVLKD